MLRGPCNPSAASYPCQRRGAVGFRLGRYPPARYTSRTATRQVRGADCGNGAGRATAQLGSSTPRAGATAPPISGSPTTATPDRRNPRASHAREASVTAKPMWTCRTTWNRLCGRESRSILGRDCPLGRWVAHDSPEFCDADPVPRVPPQHHPGQTAAPPHDDHLKRAV